MDPGEVLPRPVPDAPRAARRALCLGVLHMRSQFETSIAIARRDFPDQQESMVSLHLGLNAGLCDWLADEGHWTELTAGEVDLMTPPLGNWPIPPQLGAAERIEGLATLAWALGVIPELPPFDTAQAAADTLDALALGSPSQDFVASASLLDPAVLAGARELAEFWLWRYRFARGPDLAPEHLAAIAGAAALAHDEGHFEAIEGDFPALGGPYRALPEADQNRLGSIAEGRLRALNWLCGFALLWDQVPTET